MTKLIVNADDFGYSKGVNLGIIEAHTNGIVTSATLMANMPYSEHAAKLAHAHPNLGVGVHLVLTCGSPVSADVPSLVDKHGQFHSQQQLFSFAAATHIEREFNAQIQAFFALGLDPTHIDSHHHVHAHEKIAPIVMRLAKQYGLPVRQTCNNFANLVMEQGLHVTERFLAHFYGEGATKEHLLHMLDEAIGCDAVEIMCHPAYVDAELLHSSSYNVERVRELAILTDPEIRDAVMKRRFKLTSFREIKQQTHT